MWNLNLNSKSFIYLRICSHNLQSYRTSTQIAQLEYKYGTKERNDLEEALLQFNTNQKTVYTYNGPIRTPTGDVQYQRMPDNHERSIATFFYAGRDNLKTGIKHALSLREKWRNVCPTERLKIWRKCADLIETKYRHRINAALMLGQAKPYQQAEEDTCNLLEALRLNADYLMQLSQLKLTNAAPDKVYSSFHMRPLDGFVAAITPYTSVALSANLAFAPALMGNVVLWKPSTNCILSSYLVFRAMLEAGLPKGVVSFIPCNCHFFLDTIAKSPHLAGINFTGTTKALKEIIHKVSLNLEKYTCYPRVVGECGGNNFHFVHESANLDLVLESTISAAFKYSGQLCSSCSRMYVPESMWPDLKTELEREVCGLRVGAATDFRSFTSSVINETVFDRVVSYLIYSQKSPDVEVISGGDFCKTLGYFVEPTILKCKNPLDRLMTDEILGPILSVYVYKNYEFAKTLSIAAKTSKSGFTGAIFVRNDAAAVHMLEALQMSAANMYINDPCTGQKLGIQKFSGNRLSGTNDKPGGAYYLLRWTSPQLVEEIIDTDDSTPNFN